MHFPIEVTGFFLSQGEKSKIREIQSKVYFDHDTQAGLTFMGKTAFETVDNVEISLFICCP
jgi:hypothetical protein